VVTLCSDRSEILIRNFARASKQGISIEFIGNISLRCQLGRLRRTSETIKVVRNGIICQDAKYGCEYFEKTRSKTRGLEKET
jgi:hypothetical protein